jgi:CheY-like chemotaxis protein
MDLIPGVINSLAALIWPIIVLAVIYYFRLPIAETIESLKSRKFTMKIGGQELTMEEVNQQQQTLIADVQAQIVELRKKVEGAPVSLEVLPGPQPPPAAPPSNAILWVDDNPKNNSYFIAQLANRGISVDLALSTSEGMGKFERGSYRYVISDMGREEDSHFNHDAGLDLLKYVRERNPDIPFILFCHPNAVRDFAEKARAMGVTGITSSPTDLFALLGLDQAAHRA